MGAFTMELPRITGGSRALHDPRLTELSWARGTEPCAGISKVTGESVDVNDVVGAEHVVELHEQPFEGRGRQSAFKDGVLDAPPVPLADGGHQGQSPHTLGRTGPDVVRDQHIHELHTGDDIRWIGGDVTPEVAGQQRGLHVGEAPPADFRASCRSSRSLTGTGAVEVLVSATAGCGGACGGVRTT